MKTQLTINYIKYYNFYHLAMTCVIIIAFNASTMVNVAECTYTEPRPSDEHFISYVHPSDLPRPPEGMKKDGLLQGVYASGYVKKPIINWVTPVVEIKMPNVIEHKEFSILNYIKSWFSREAWYIWYNQELIDVQKANRSFLPPMVVLPKTILPILAPITLDISTNSTSLMLTSEALDNVIRLTELPPIVKNAQVCTAFTVDEQKIQLSGEALFSVHISLPDIVDNRTLNNNSNRLMEPILFVDMSLQDIPDKLILNTKSNKPMLLNIPLIIKNAQVCTVFVVDEQKIQLFGEALSSADISLRDIPDNPSLTSERNRPAALIPLVHMSLQDVPDEPTLNSKPAIPMLRDNPIISQPDVQITPEDVPTAQKDDKSMLRQAYLRYQPDMMQLVHIDYKTEAEIIDELEMNYTIEKRQLIDPETIPEKSRFRRRKR